MGMENSITLFSARDMDRLRVIQQRFADLSAVKAARILGLSVRQVFRVKARVRQDGPNGILHCNRGHTHLDANAANIDSQ